MSLTTVPLRRNLLFRSVNLPKGNPLLSLRAIPFLIVLAGSFAILPIVRANPVLKTIVVDGPDSLEGIIADPTRSVVYVADAASNRIGVIDTNVNQLSFFIPTANHPIGLGLSPDASVLYVTEDPTFLEAISLTTFKQLFITTVDSNPGIPGISSNGTTVYVPCQGTGKVLPFGGPLTGMKITVGGTPVDVVFNHGNTLAYVTNVTTNISIIDTATGSVTTIPTATQSFGLAIRGGTLYATGINVVFVIDTRLGTVIDTIKVPTPTPGNFQLALPALTPDGAFLYVPLVEKLPPPTTLLNNTVVVIKTKTREVVGKPITVGNAPIQVAAAAFGPAALQLLGYSSNLLDGTVTVFVPRRLPF